MSGENITILEGGKAENFGQVTKLKTSNGSGHDLWVPKTDVKTGHLSVKKNGLYYTNQYEPTASEKKDGKFYDIYGWDTITVSVKKKVTGKKKKKSPKTGKEYDAPMSVDVDENGNLIETELPVYIEIIKQPNKLDYVNGESISISGIKVMAYYGDDEEWGVVPYNELSFDPTTAYYSGDEEEIDVDDLNQPIYFMPITTGKEYISDRSLLEPIAIGETGNRYVESITHTAPVYQMWFTETISGEPYPRMAWVSSAPFSAVTKRIAPSSWSPQTQYIYSSSHTYNDQTAYIAVLWRAGSPYYGHPFGSQSAEQSIDIADAIVLAQTQGHSHGSGAQDVTVMWHRPEDEEELTDDFSITVHPSN